MQFYVIYFTFLYITTLSDFISFLNAERDLVK